MTSDSCVPQEILSEPLLSKKSAECSHVSRVLPQPNRHSNPMKWNESSLEVVLPVITIYRNQDQHRLNKRDEKCVNWWNIYSWEKAPFTFGFLWKLNSSNIQWKGMEKLFRNLFESFLYFIQINNNILLSFFYCFFALEWNKM